MKTNKPIPSTVKFSPELQKKIDLAHEKTGMPKQQLIRICVEMGLEDLKRIDWNIAEALSNAANSVRGSTNSIAALPSPRKKNNGTQA